MTSTSDGFIRIESYSLDRSVPATMANTRQIDRALVLFAATTTATILVTIVTFWLGSEFKALRWLAFAWALAVWLLMWVGLLPILSGISSWLVGAGFTLYWQMVTFGI